MTARKSPLVIRQARAIVRSPDKYAHKPLTRMMAWATLKSARGQTIRQRRLCDMIRENRVAA